MQNVNKQKPFDFVLCIVIFLLLSLGIVMVLSASAPYSLSQTGTSYYYVIRQGGFAVAGVVLMLFISKIDYHVYKKFYKLAYGFSLLLLASVAIPGLGAEENGANRWLNLGIISFQPSEVAKILLIIYYAGYLTDHKNELGYLGKGCIKAFLRLALPILILYFLQDHLSASIVIVLITSIMMIMSGVKLRHFTAVGAVLGSAAAARNAFTCTS